MRKFCLALCALAALSLACLTAALAEGFTLICETDALMLYLDEATLQTKIVNKQSGVEYYTKILDGKKGNGASKNNQKSDFRAYYVVNEKTLTTNSMDSNSMSVAYENYTVNLIENGFEIAYEIGDMTLTVDDLPKMIPVTKYNELLLPYWTTKNDDAFREFYRIVQNTMWVRTDDGNIGKMKLSNLYKLIYETGKYTKDDLTEDNAAYDYVIEKVNPKIDLTIRFQLDGDDLLVSVPCGEISYTVGNMPTRLDILPYFMTATTQDEGYIFVPDGSGALIYLNNGKTMALSYTDTVYGSDPLKNVNKYSPVSDSINLPIYGLKTQDGATLAIIEKGAEIATLFADISGRSDDINRVYSYFTLRDVELVQVVGDSGATTPRYPSDVYEGDIVIRYKFLSGENATAMGMADAYRAYLIGRGMLKEKEPEADAPLFVELIGAVRADKFFLGIPYTSTSSATTLAQARTVYDALLDAGAKNVVLMPDGIFEGGVWHESLNGVTLEGKVGDKKQLAALKARVEETGGKFYPGANLVRVYDTADFKKNSQAARRQDNFIASVTLYNEGILAPRHSDPDSFYLSPRCLTKYAQNALSGIRKLDLTALRVNDLAGMLIPDYRKDEQISRIHATETNIQALSTLADGLSLALNDPNDYALRFADIVTGLSATDNGHKVLDEAIPFTEWVLDGCATYTAKPWNDSAYNGIRKQFLYAIESKSAPYFRLTYENERVFFHTEVAKMTGFFMTEYSQWLDTIHQVYGEFDVFWDKVGDSRAVLHEIPAHGLRKTTYENGVTVYVNYNSLDARADGLTVPAEGYLITEGGAE